MRPRFFNIKPLLIHLIILSAILVGCSKPSPSATSYALEISSTSVSSNTIEPSASATPVPTLDFSEYKLDLVLDYEAKHARVSEVIRYQNNTGGELSELVLAVEPNLWLDCFLLESIMHIFWRPTFLLVLLWLPLWLHWGSGFSRKVEW